MPFSTSSSDAYRRAPALAWGRIWVAALLLAVFVLAGWETFWRERGYRPSTTDDKALWAFWRGRVYGPSGGTVVLLGASRMRLDFSTRTFRRRFPDLAVVQLAVNGRNPMATLRDLAGDEDFAGVVLCAATPMSFLPRGRNDQQGHVDFYRRAPLHRLIEPILRSFVQSRLALLHPGLGWKRLLVRRLRGQPPPPPPYFVTHFDRSEEADFSGLDLAALRRHRMAELQLDLDRRGDPSPALWERSVRKAGAQAHRIVARGGRVVFLFFPLSPGALRLVEQRFPRADYWDRIPALAGVPAIHFGDLEAGAPFRCPDTSHLDRKDAPRFTRILLEELSRRGILP